MNEQLLKTAFTLVASQVKRRYKQGKIQTWQSTDGYLALMVDKIQRYFTKGGYDEVLDLCVDSVVALSTLIQYSNDAKRVDEALDTEEVTAELEQEIAAEMPPEERKVNPNALEEGGALDPRWSVAKERDL